MRPVSRRVGAAAPLVAGGCWLIYAYIVKQFDPSYYRPIAFVDYLAVALYSAGLLLLAPTVAGIHARQHTHAGLDERIGFWMAFAGGLMAGIGDFGEDWVRVEPMGHWLLLPGMLLLLIGLALLGVGTMRAKVLPTWCGGLLLLSPIVGGPLRGLFSNWSGTLLFGLIWMTLGFALWFDHRNATKHEGKE